MFLVSHLLEDRLGDIVVGAPVGSTLRIGELVHEMAPGFHRNTMRFRIDVRWIANQVAAPAIELDRLDFRP